MELGDDRKDYPLFAMTDAFGKIATRADLCLLAFLLCGDGRAEGPPGKKRLRKLVFQVNPVGNNNDATLF
jgi:hypothetical protein